MYPQRTPLPSPCRIITFLCWQKSVSLLQLIVVAGMGPIVALKYFRFTYRPSKINLLQQTERLGGPILSLGNIEPQPKSVEKEVSPLSISHLKSRNPVFEPLLSDSPTSLRRSFGPGTPLDFFQSQGRLSSNYSRNCKDNWFLNLDECIALYEGLVSFEMLSYSCRLIAQDTIRMYSFW